MPNLFNTFRSGHNGCHFQATYSNSFWCMESCIWFKLHSIRKHVIILSSRRCIKPWWFLSTFGCKLNCFYNDPKKYLISIAFSPYMLSRIFIPPHMYLYLTDKPAFSYIAHIWCILLILLRTFLFLLSVGRPGFRSGDIRTHLSLHNMTSQCVRWIYWSKVGIFVPREDCWLYVWWSSIMTSLHDAFRITCPFRRESPAQWVFSLLLACQHTAQQTVDLSTF